jgi:SAM-dependent methyltransferase
MDRIERVAAARGFPTDPTRRAAAVAALSQTYTRRRQDVHGVADDDTALLARLVFFLPRDMARMGLPLEELRGANALPPRRTWRVLDLGAGLGATTLGVAAFAHAHDLADSLRVVAVDRDERALSVLKELTARPEELGLLPLALDTQQADALSFDPFTSEAGFDLIVAGLVLNELWSDRFDEAAAAALIQRWATALAPGGSMVILEPALRDTARRLMAVRDRIAAGSGPARVFAPCVRSGPCPMLENDRDWCHSDLPGELPGGVAELAAAAGLRTERRTLAHLTLRVDGRQLGDGRVVGHGELHRVVSSPQRSKGKCERMGCGDSGLVRWMRLDRHAGPATRDLEQARRGDLLVTTGGELRGGRLRLGPTSSVRRWGEGTGST